SFGPSLSNVLIPTNMLSTEAVKRWTLLRPDGDDIRESPVYVAIFPSRLIAAVRLTEGREFRLPGMVSSHRGRVLPKRPNLVDVCLISGATYRGVRGSLRREDGT